MTQSRALELMASGANIFLCGPPGSGKSYVLEQFIRAAQARAKRVAVTATTGIAASLLNGVTIHSWSGMRTKHRLGAADMTSLLNDSSLVQRLNSTEILIIDEISMLDATTLDSLNNWLKVARASKVGFGGLQIILSGDFFQLPPVSVARPEYCFKAKCWTEAALKVCYLSEQHRQTGDELAEILSALREQRFNKFHLRLLSERQAIPHQPTTMLMTHNKDVDQINSTRLERLEGKSRTYYAKLTGPTDATFSLRRSVLAPSELRLKVGAEVMFVANDPLRRYVNGSQGRIVGFKFNLPQVELKDSGLVLLTQAKCWKLENETKAAAELVQLPLKLAWAITIHKCQGMSLNEADIDLKRSFTYGMGYVALSRLKSYQGLYLSSYNTRSLQLDKTIYAFDRALNKESHLNESQQIYSDQAKLIASLYRSGMSLWLIQQSVGLSERQLREELSQLGLVSK